MLPSLDLSKLRTFEMPRRQVANSLLESMGLEDTAFKDLLWLAGAKFPPPATIDPSRVDWPRLIRLAYEQRMLPLLHGRIVASLQTLGGHEEHIRLLHKAQLDVLRRNLALAAETLRLLDALAAAGIEALAFKGGVLSLAVYHQLAARKDGDIDILVKREQTPAALGILEKCGYEPYRQFSQAETLGHLKHDCECELFNSEKAVGADLHWEFSSRNSGMPVPQFLEQIWSRPQTVVLCGRPIRTLRTEDLVLMLSIHAAKHQWQRLEWIHTLARLLNDSPDLDWEVLFQTAHACNTERTLMLGLTICDAVYDVALSTEILQRIQVDRPVRELAQRALGWLFHGQSETLSAATMRKFNLDTRATLFAKAYYLTCVIATPSAKDYLVQLPPWLGWVYWFIRAGRLLVVNIGHLFSKPLALPPKQAVHWIPKPEILQLVASKDRAGIPLT